MKIDRKLNLVIPVETEAGLVYVHSTPISRDLFERYFLVISMTFAELIRKRLDVMAGPRISMLLLRQIASDTGDLSGPAGVEAGLIAEIRRLTNIAAPSGSGWQMLPYDDAVRAGSLTEDDAKEVDNFLAFFTVASHMFPREDVRGILGGMSQLWGVQSTSSSCTEWVNSLSTSIAIDSSGETETTSSVPH